MSPLPFALLTGLLSGGHCLAMCGPLAFAIPSANRGWLLFTDKLQYQAGRVVSYVFLGIIAGVVGQQLWLGGLQRTLSVVTGVLVLGSAAGLIAAPLLPRRLANAALWRSLSVRPLLGYALKHRAGHFTIGVLNGFLPCGMVWMALAGAVNMGSAAGAAGYMAVFGAGTVPVLLAATIGASWITPLVRRNLAKAGPFLMIVIGCWLIVRAPLMKAGEAVTGHHKGPVSWCGGVPVK